MSEAGGNKHAPLVTISLVTYNGLRWLPGCLASVARQTMRDFELLVVDNASTDGSLKWLRERQAELPWLVLESSATNLGFAAAHNRNIFSARGEFVCLLNQDVELDEHFLAAAVASFADRPRVAAVQGKLFRLEPDGTHSNVLDSSGLVMRRNRRVNSRGQGEKGDDCYAASGPVWGADGPAPVYRMAALMDVREPRTRGGWEVLDEDFFMYKEDVDLAWRLRTFGWTAWYAPKAIAWHARGAGGSPARTLLAIVRTNRTIPGRIKVLSWRNQRLMQLKNDSLRAFLRDLPWIMRREVLSMGFILAADPGQLRAVPQLLRALSGARRKRRFLRERLRPQSTPQVGVD